jgi:hypothetical protein
MDSSIVEFIKSVSIASCRVTSTPQLVFLCGGVTANSRASPLRSARDYFYRYITAQAPNLAQRVRLAEEINDWFDQDTFPDLLELEIYLADLSDLTILFVESAGSIAELGAFAASEFLRPKTLAILNSTHPPNRSFIADGPVRRIKREDENLVRYYEWNTDNIEDPANLDVFEDMSKELVQYTVDRAATKPKEKILDSTSHGHKMLLIADLVDLIGITTATEIMECFSLWELKLDKKVVQRYLSLLEHLKLIQTKLYSDQTYFLSSSTSALIRYDFKPGTTVRDRGRIKTIIRTALSASDQRRIKVYKRELLRRAGRGPGHV